ncbi:MAG: hypothetical protein ACOX7H_09140 [Bacillota bacterium]
MNKKSVYGFIPVPLHRELKAKLAQEGKTVQQFIEMAVAQYLSLRGQHWQELPFEVALAIENNLEKNQIIYKGQDYLLAVIASDGDGPKAAAYCWRSGYPAEFATGSREIVRELVEEEIRGWEVSQPVKDEAVDRLNQILNN